ncbi:MAG: hypothetical protein AAGG09_10230 [Pseudomonadota bacterium]
MFQFRALRAFLADESGAVTVDWVVLTATIVGLGLAVIGTLGSAFAPNAQNIGTELQEYTIDTTF